MRTYKRNGIYYISFDKGQKARWSSTGLRNYAEVIHKYKEATAPQLAPSTHLAPFIEQYLERLSTQVRSGTLRTYRFVLKEFLSIVGNKPLASIDAQDIFKFSSSRIKKGIEPSTINTSLRYIHAFLVRANQWGLSSTPAPKVELLRVPLRTPRYISETELAQILKLVKDRTLNFLFYLSFFTGVRLAEAINLPWVNVDEEVFQVVISNYKNFETKSGRTRQIPLTIKLSTLLKLHKLECVKKYKRLPEYVFVHSGHRYSPSYVSDTFTKTARKAGLEGVHFHTLRHSFASLLVQRGVSLYVVQGLLGHSSIRVTEQYAHLAPSTLRKGIDALDEVLNPKR